MTVREFLEKCTFAAHVMFKIVDIDYDSRCTPVVLIKFDPAGWRFIKADILDMHVEKWFIDGNGELTICVEVKAPDD